MSQDKLFNDDSNTIFVKNERIQLGNFAARTRMMILYHIAHKLNGLVIGTGNKSEYILGYYRYNTNTTNSLLIFLIFLFLNILSITGLIYMIRYDKKQKS